MRVWTKKCVNLAVIPIYYCIKVVFYIFPSNNSGRDLRVCTRLSLYSQITKLNKIFFDFQLLPLRPTRVM